MKCCQFFLLTQWSSISCSSARTLSFCSSVWRSCSFTFCSLALSFVFSFLCSWGKGYELCFLPKCVLHNICENSVLVLALEKIQCHSQIAFVGPHSEYHNAKVSRIIGPLLIDAANFFTTSNHKLIYNGTFHCHFLWEVRHVYYCGLLEIGNFTVSAGK